MKACRKCGVEQELDGFHRDKNSPDGHVHRCKACVKAADRARYEAKSTEIKEQTRQYARENREKIRAKNREYRQRNLERKREADRAYYAANRDLRKQKSQAWRSKNKIRIAQVGKIYHRANRLQIAAYGKAWKQANRTAVCAAIDRRRQRVDVHLCAAARALSVEYRGVIAGDPCVYCGAPSRTVDHIEPLGRSGTDHWWNLAPACMTCNTSKQAKDLLSFMEWRLRTEVPA